MKIGVVGAGAVGGALAVAISHAGVPVVLLRRRPEQEALSLRLRSGRRIAPRAPIEVVTDPEALGGVALCLICVKASATTAVARALAPVLGRHVVVLSLQNGMRNVERLEAELVATVVGGVVGFNLVAEGGVRWQTSAGRLYAGSGSGGTHQRMIWLRDTLHRAPIRLSLRHDIDAVIAGKLLINLNNGLCAATGLSIRDSIASRDARWCYAQLLHEGLQCMRAAGVRPAKAGLLPPDLLAAALQLPDVLIRRGAAAIDERARSSTLVDLDAGRPTEIDELNGAVVRLADASGHNAPLNRLVTRLVHDHERAIAEGRAPAYVSPALLRARFEQLTPSSRPSYPVLRRGSSSKASPFHRMSSK